MVGPTGVGDVDGLVARVEALEESTTDSEGTGTRDGLSDDDSALVERCRVGAVCEDGGSLGTPVMPAYSLSRFFLTTLCSASFTEGRT